MYCVQFSEVFGGVGAVAHLDVSVRGDAGVDPLHRAQHADPLALLQRAPVLVRLQVEQLEAQALKRGWRRKRN